jgi:hypothetical protein
MHTPCDIPHVNDAPSLEIKDNSIDGTVNNPYMSPSIDIKRTTMVVYWLWHVTGRWFLHTSWHMHCMWILM